MKPGPPVSQAGCARARSVAVARQASVGLVLWPMGLLVNLKLGLGKCSVGAGKVLAFSILCICFHMWSFYIYALVLYILASFGTFHD
jgi:hypothetical protein